MHVAFGFQKKEQSEIFIQSQSLNSRSCYFILGLLINYQRDSLDIYILVVQADQYLGILKFIEYSNIYQGFFYILLMYIKCKFSSLYFIMSLSINMSDKIRLKLNYSSLLIQELFQFNPLCWDQCQCKFSQFSKLSQVLRYTIISNCPLK